MKIKQHKYNINELRKQGQKLIEDIWTEKTPELYQDYKADIERIIIEAYTRGYEEGSKKAK